MKSNEKIFNILFNEDEVTWQSIIYDLVKSEEIDPWDVDVSLLSSKYLVMLKKLKELDFRISGKVLLAAAMLLKIKSNRLMSTDMINFDNMFKPVEDDETLGDFFDSGDLDDQLMRLDGLKDNKPSLIPRTPQPRERKVTIFDLVDALEKALNVKKRRVLKELPDVDIKAPVKTRDITEIIREVYTNVKTHLVNNKNKTLSFYDLIPSQSKEDKIMTFVPLLHLENQRKVNLEQHQHFSPIFIKMMDKKR